MQFAPPFGHAPAPHGLRPDIIHERPRLYARYVRGLYALLSEQAKKEGKTPLLNAKQIEALIASVTSAEGPDPEPVEILRLREFAEKELGTTLPAWRPEDLGARDPRTDKPDAGTPPELKNLDIGKAESLAKDWANPKGNWTKTRAKTVPFSL
jgi:hypothetical protein